MPPAHGCAFAIFTQGLWCFSYLIAAPPFLIALPPFGVWISVVRTRASSNNFSSRGRLKCYLLALVKATGKNYVLASL